MATVVAIVAIVVATIIASSRVLRLLFQELDLLAYVGLFVSCWIGAGGALVPIPGVRPISWLMIIHQSAALDPVIVALVGALAMTLGQTSYFLATRAAANRTRAPRASTSAEPPAGPIDPPGDELDARPPSRRARAMTGARERVGRQVGEHGIATVFAVCALPSPLTTLTTTIAAASGMGYARYLPAAFGGYLVWCSVLALFGQGLLLAWQSVTPFR